MPNDDGRLASSQKYLVYMCISTRLSGVYQRPAAISHTVTHSLQIPKVSQLKQGT